MVGRQSGIFLALFVKNNFEKKTLFVFYRNVDEPEAQPEDDDDEEQFQIFVKDISGKTITLDVKGSNTIGDVKAKIQDKLWRWGDPKWFYLKFESHELAYDRTLSDYNVQAQSTIYINCCLLGFVLNYSKIVVYFYKK